MPSSCLSQNPLLFLPACLQLFREKRAGLRCQRSADRNCFPGLSLSIMSSLFISASSFGTFSLNFSEIILGDSRRTFVCFKIHPINCHPQATDVFIYLFMESRVLQSLWTRLRTADLVFVLTSPSSSVLWRRLVDANVHDRSVGTTRARSLVKFKPDD